MAKFQFFLKMHADPYLCHHRKMQKALSAVLVFLLCPCLGQSNKLWLASDTPLENPVNATARDFVLQPNTTSIGVDGVQVSTPAQWIPARRNQTSPVLTI
ncbi:hypothetical protein, partial [Deinococcus roseus]|uniref:hypothetical protein n=1 Tax=Deinococcus roseus TaxID=392414 RepID=UPI001E3E5377